MPNLKWDLIVTFDDATNEIYSAFFVDQEGTMSILTALQEVIHAKGLFSILYTDRSSHYWLTREADCKVDKLSLMQVHRALKQLSIQLIPDYSPEACGRSERLFGALQGRWPQELRIAGITDMVSANEHLKAVLIPEYNKEFMIKLEGKGNAFTPWIGGSEQLIDIISVQEKRVVGKDNTVHYCNTILQIPKDKYRYHYVKANVMVHEYPEGGSVFQGPKCLARYDKEGKMKDMEEISLLPGVHGDSCA